MVERHGLWIMLECGQCKLQFAHPMRSPDGFYDKVFYAGTSLEEIRHLDARAMAGRAKRLGWPVFEFALEWMREEFVGRPVVLDIGCGRGAFLAMASLEGIDAFGTDIAVEPVQVLRSKGFRVHCGSHDTIPEDWPDPDVVTAFEVLEHVPDPLGFLRSIHEKFPQARLLLSTPSPERWSLKVGLREDWDYPPNHLTRWSEASLEVVLRRAGYARVDFVFPEVCGLDVYWIVVGHTLHKLRLRERGKGSVDGSDTGAARVLSEMLGKARWIRGLYFFGAAVSNRLLGPIALYFNRKGWCLSSMLALAQ